MLFVEVVFVGVDPFGGFGVGDAWESVFAKDWALKLKISSVIIKPVRIFEIVGDIFVLDVFSIMEVEGRVLAIGDGSFLGTVLVKVFAKAARGWIFEQHRHCQKRPSLARLEFGPPLLFSLPSTIDPQQFPLWRSFLILKS